MALSEIEIPSIAEVSPTESQNSATNGGHANLHNLTSALAVSAAELANALLDKIGLEERVVGLLENAASIPAADAERVQLYNRGDNLEVRMPSGEVFLLVHNTTGLNLPGGIPRRLAKLDATVSRAAASGTGEHVIWQMPTLPAGFTSTGDYFQLRFAGRLTQTASGPTHRLRLRWSDPASPTAGTILVDTGAKNVGSARTNGGWVVQNLMIADQGEGGAGFGSRAYWPTGRIEGLFSGDTYQGAGFALGPAGTDTPASAKIDVVGNDSRCLVLTVQWSATTSGNTFFIDNGELYICRGVA